METDFGLIKERKSLSAAINNEHDRVASKIWSLIPEFMIDTFSYINVNVRLEDNEVIKKR
jgi:hypothetical protein